MERLVTAREFSDFQEAVLLLLTAPEPLRTDAALHLLACRHGVVEEAEAATREAARSEAVEALVWRATADRAPSERVTLADLLEQAGA